MDRKTYVFVYIILVLVRIGILGFLLNSLSPILRIVTFMVMLVLILHISTRLLIGLLKRKKVLHSYIVTLRVAGRV